MISPAMATTAAAHAELSRLRRDIARIEGRLAEDDRLPDAVLARSIPRSPSCCNAADRRKIPRAAGARHRVSRHGPRRRPAFGGADRNPRRRKAATAGWRAALRWRSSRGSSQAGTLSSIVWIGEADLRRETGRLYAPGLVALGLDPAACRRGRRAHREGGALGLRGGALLPRRSMWRSASSEKLRSIFPPRAAARFAPARAGVTGFLLRLGNEWAEPSAAEIRFGVAPAPAGEIGDFAAGIGRMAWRLTLEKNRLGPTGAFTVEWNAHERSFVERGEGTAVADPEPLSAASSDRPPHPSAAEEERCGARAQARLVKIVRKGAARRRRKDQERASRRRRRRKCRAAGNSPGRDPRRCARRRPRSCVEEADEAADHALLEKLADWCDRYTPLVALDPPHGLFLDISGCAHLFSRGADDGEAALLADCPPPSRRAGF